LSSEQRNQAADLELHLVLIKRDQLADLHRDVLFMKYDLRDLIPATIWMGGILVINLFVTVYCAVSVYQIKHSTTPNQAVQMEANQ
jgi:hypothetical protein